MLGHERALGQTRPRRRDGDPGIRNDGEQGNNGDQGQQHDDHSDGEWHEVVRKKKRSDQGGGGRLDVAAAAKFSYDDTVSFFFSDFPETHGAKDILKAFRLYGEGVEVVIPAKRDKRGKRFGFVRFGKVNDPRLFAIRLDNMIFGSAKIHVNIPRFQRQRTEINHSGLHHAQRAMEKQHAGLIQPQHTGLLQPQREVQHQRNGSIQPQRRLW